MDRPERSSRCIFPVACCPRAALDRPASRSSRTESSPEAGTASSVMGHRAPWMYHRLLESETKLEARADTPCFQLWEPPRSHAFWEPPRSQCQCQSRLEVMWLVAAARHSGQPESPALDAAASIRPFPSCPAPIDGSSAAAVFDRWHCGRFGGRAGRCRWLASYGDGWSRCTGEFAAEVLSLPLVVCARPQRCRGSSCCPPPAFNNAMELTPGSECRRRRRLGRGHHQRRRRRGQHVGRHGARAAVSVATGCGDWLPCAAVGHKAAALSAT